MFNKKKKNPPPRPPPPNFNKYKSKSSYNLNHNNGNLIDWSPPNTPKPEHSHAGSVSSSYSSSTSSLTSSKKSLENDNSMLALISNLQSRENGSNLKPRIIRPVPSKKSQFGAIDSPPMPNVPPPKLPQGQYNVVTPYGIALFDFPATQPGDLALQANDVVELIRKVNAEWFYGRIYNREGIFPINFIQVEVPLTADTGFVTALYEFKPQMSGDLSLKPGQKIQVLHQISDEWLYGISEGQEGQFPRNFVS